MVCWYICNVEEDWGCMLSCLPCHPFTRPRWIAQVKGETLEGILRSIKSLAKHHSDVTFATLVEYEAPHEDSVIQAVQVAHSCCYLQAGF